jgi:hypothetical protein
MSWKRLFSIQELIGIMTKRNYVFLVDESLRRLIVKVKENEEWFKNRNKTQTDLLKLIKEKPELFNLIYKLSDFVAKDRRYFTIKCSGGGDKTESNVWKNRHREDILRNIIAEKIKLSIDEKELKSILCRFFLASPELFLEDHRSNGEKFSVTPREYDALYFLSATQTELDRLYAGLLTDDSVFIKSWLELLQS